MQINAYAERFILTLKQECLDHFLVLGQRHFNHLLHEFVEHYNTEQVHMQIGRPPKGMPPPPQPPAAFTRESQVMCDERLGGLLRS